MIIHKTVDSATSNCYYRRWLKHSHKLSQKITVVKPMDQSLERWLNIETTLLQNANTKHLYNINTTSVKRRRRWTNIVSMLYKCFVFAVLSLLAPHRSNLFLGVVAALATRCPCLPPVLQTSFLSAWHYTPDNHPAHCGQGETRLSYPTRILRQKHHGLHHGDNTLHPGARDYKY